MILLHFFFQKMTLNNQGKCMVESCSTVYRAENNYECNTLAPEMRKFYF